MIGLAHLVAALRQLRCHVAEDEDPVIVIPRGHRRFAWHAIEGCGDGGMPGLPAGAKLIVDFQLQVEHALDIADAERVLFIDAETGLDCDCHLRKVAAGGGTSVSRHALSPGQLLAVHAQVCATPAPEAYVLGVAGQRFELGEDLSAL